MNEEYLSSEASLEHENNCAKNSLKEDYQPEEEEETKEIKI